MKRIFTLLTVLLTVLGMNARPVFVASNTDQAELKLPTLREILQLPFIKSVKVYIMQRMTRLFVSIMQVELN